jgi:Arc/MetJ-type ribon-helix-helix transcriptional regulator
MTIRLPEELANYIHAKVQSGRFASDDDAIAEAVWRFRQWEQEQEQSRQAANATTAVAEAAAPTFKPIWEEIEEITAGVPDEEFLKLPADGATQHDHYIYGTPKRPVAQ